MELPKRAALHRFRVLPDRVQKAGYEFRFPKLERALREVVS